MLKTGICSVSFRSLSVDEVIKVVSESGLSAIEWGSDVHAPCGNIDNLKYIAKAQKAAGLVCSSYGTYYFVGINPTEQIRDYINAAKILGTNVLRLWCGKKNYTDMTEEERETLIDECRRLAKIAEQEGAVLCMECHDNSFTNTADGAVYLMNSVNSKAFRMYWQANEKTVEDNIKFAKAIAPFVENIHVFYYEDGTKRYLREGIEAWNSYLPLFDNDKFLLLEFIQNNDPKALCGEAKVLNELAKAHNS